MFIGARKRVSRWLQEQRFEMAKRQLESEIRRIIDLVEGHKAAGLASGHVYYQLLRGRADVAIARLQEQAGSLGLKVPERVDIAMGIPALKEIEELASGSSLTNKGTIALVAGLAVPFFVTAMLSLCQGLHSWLLHLLAR